MSIESQNKVLSPILYNRQNLVNGLYIIATPIGNLRDISLRALDIIASVNRLYVEDTRYSTRIFKTYNIKPNYLKSYHDHSTESLRNEIINHISKGESVGLMSDAGTPLISDPGYKLVRSIRSEGLSVFPVPGPTACIAALSSSGLPTDRFCFLGFPPVREGGRKKFYESISDLEMTLIFYESNKRLLTSLKSMQHYLGNRIGIIAREITKRYESFKEDTLCELIRYYHQHETPKGEIVILLKGADQKVLDDQSIRDILLNYLDQGSLKQSVVQMSHDYDLSRKKLYQMALELSGKNKKA